MQTEGTKLIFVMKYSGATFLQICLQNGSNCINFSLRFQYFLGEGGGMPPDPPSNFLLFSISNSRL